MERATAPNQNTPENVDIPEDDPSLREAVAERVREKVVETAAVLQIEQDPELHAQQVNREAYEQATEREAQVASVRLMQKREGIKRARRMVYPWDESYFNQADERKNVYHELSGTEPEATDDNLGELDNNARAMHEAREARKLTVNLGKQIAERLKESGVQPNTTVYEAHTKIVRKKIGDALLNHGKWFAKVPELYNKELQSGWVLPLPFLLSCLTYAMPIARLIL